MAEGEVKVIFKSQADLKAAKEMQDAVKQMQTQLSHVPEGMAKVEEATKKTDEATSKTGKSFLGLRDLARGLTSEFPLLGRAVQMMLNPMSLAVATIAGMVKGFMDWSQAIDDAMEKSQSLSRFTKTLDGVRETQYKLTVQAREFATELAKIGVSTDPVGDNLKKKTDRANDSLKATKESLTVEQDLERLRIESGEGTALEKTAALDKLGLSGISKGSAAEREAENSKLSAMMAAKNAFEDQKNKALELLPGARQKAESTARNAVIASEAEREAAATMADEAPILESMKGRFTKEGKAKTWKAGYDTSVSAIWGVNMPANVREKYEYFDQQKRNKEALGVNSAARAAEAKVAKKELDRLEKQALDAKLGVETQDKAIKDAREQSEIAETARRIKDQAAKDTMGIQRRNSRAAEANKVLEDQGFGYRYNADTVPEFQSRREAARSLRGLPGLPWDASPEDRKDAARQTATWEKENIEQSPPEPRRSNIAASNENLLRLVVDKWSKQSDDEATGVRDVIMQLVSSGAIHIGVTEDVKTKVNQLATRLEQMASRYESGR